MSLQSRLASLISAIGGDIGTLEEDVGTLWSELGSNPSGSFVNVAERLDALVVGTDPTVQVAQLDAATSQTFSGLNGDIDGGYEIHLMGRLVQGGASRNIWLKPNGLTLSAGGSRRLSHGSYKLGDAAAPVSDNPGTAAANEVGLLLGGGFGSEDTAINNRITFLAKTGSRRLCRAQALAAGVQSGTDSDIGSFIHNSAWENTTTPVSSLVIDFGGGTFTGIAVLKPIRSSALGGSTPPLVTPTEFRALTPRDGMLVDVLIDATAGVIWRFRYRAASGNTSKWEFVGGAELYQNTDAGFSTGSTSYTTPTNGPSLTLPLAGDYNIEQGASMSNNGAWGVNRQSFMVGATAASDADAALHMQPQGQVNSGASVVAKRRKTGVAVNTTITTQVKVNSGSGSFSERFMSILPIRVNQT